MTMQKQLPEKKQKKYILMHDIKEATKNKLFICEIFENMYLHQVDPEPAWEEWNSGDEGVEMNLC